MTGHGFSATCLFLQAITLALQSMSYDFVGTCLDESSEDLGTIQVQLTLQPHVPGTPYITWAEHSHVAHTSFPPSCHSRTHPDLLLYAQVPSTWRPLIEDPSTLQLMLDFYSVTKPPLSSIALECLVRALHHLPAIMNSNQERRILFGVEHSMGPVAVATSCDRAL